MKQHPILFSTPMVQAILQGRKSMTRRVINPQPTLILGPYDEWCEMMIKSCKYKTGDQLWVRERFFELVDPETSKPYDEPKFMYYASYEAQIDGEVFTDDGDGGMAMNKNGTIKNPWKPSIHMPFAACRLFLDIKGIKVERLQDISEEDAKAEGAERGIFREGPHTESGEFHLELNQHAGYKDGFKYIWMLINGRDSWNANPFVWCIEFNRIEK